MAAWSIHPDESEPTPDASFRGGRLHLFAERAVPHDQAEKGRLDGESPLGREDDIERTLERPQVGDMGDDEGIGLDAKLVHEITVLGSGANRWTSTGFSITKHPLESETSGGLGHVGSYGDESVRMPEASEETLRLVKVPRQAALQRRVDVAVVEIEHAGQRVGCTSRGRCSAMLVLPITMISGRSTATWASAMRCKPSPMSAR